jgi:hypothetical protein
VLGLASALMSANTPIRLRLLIPAVENSVAGNAFVLSAYGSNFGTMFIPLKPFAERHGLPVCLYAGGAPGTPTGSTNSSRSHFDAQRYMETGKPGDNTPVAHFMYQNGQGTRITLYVRSDMSGNRETAFRYAREGNVGAPVPLGSTSIGPVTNTDRSNKTSLLKRTVTSLVPVGTRTAVARLIFTQVDGSYNDGYLDNNDPTTRRMLEGILAMEETHADDLVNLLEELGS